jgi:hypothetical protein
MMKRGRSTSSGQTNSLYCKKSIFFRNKYLRNQIILNRNLNMIRRNLRLAIEQEDVFEIRTILANGLYSNKNYMKNVVKNREEPIRMDIINDYNLRLQASLPIVNFQHFLFTESEKRKLVNFPKRQFPNLRKCPTKRFQAKPRPIRWHTFYIDKQGKENALHYAVRLGKVGLVDVLLDTYYFDIDDKTNSAELDTSLMIACDLSILNMVKMLIARGADVNYENGKFKTPLIVATESISPFDYQMVEMLLSNGAKVCYSKL